MYHSQRNLQSVCVHLNTSASRAFSLTLIHVPRFGETLPNARQHGFNRLARPEFSLLFLRPRTAVTFAWIQGSTSWGDAGNVCHRNSISHRERALDDGCERVLGYASVKPIYARQYSRIRIRLLEILEAILAVNSRPYCRREI